jgi:hypothetical protein
MKLFCKDGAINTIAKDSHRDVDAFEVIRVPDDFDVVESEVETSEGVSRIYKSVDQIKAELEALK